ncbi:putative cation efflux system membrane protein C [Chlamydiales bacterium STE3]|nr:putative cation efflux system membrane protein C [Chlamydiales bacterium STE3]
MPFNKKIFLALLCFFQPLLSNILDFGTAVERTLNQSPLLQIASADTCSKKGEQQQSSLYPNPVVSYEIENFAGNKSWRGWGKREERYLYGQLFETANKRLYRYKAVSYQYYASLVGYEVSKLTVLNRLSRAFNAVAAAQELLIVAKEQANISQEVLAIAQKKVEFGKASFIQQSKAEVACEAAIQTYENALIEWEVAKKKLALLWGSTSPDFTEVVYPFYEIHPPMPFEECLTNLCNQPEVVKNVYEYLSAQKAWQLEKAKRIPNINVQIGYKADYETKEQGLMAGLSVPLPLFDQNQGNIQRAHYDMLKTGEQGKQLWLFLKSRLAISYDELQLVFSEANRFKNSILKAATQSFALAEKGYHEGKFEYLDVLDAQRTLFEMRQKYIQAIANYHNKRADIDYLNSQMD